MNYSTESWKVYYGDGSTFSNEDGPPEMAPCTGVLAVAFFNIDNRREIGASKDFYWYDETPIYPGMKGTWFAGDVSGYYQYMFRPGRKIVKFGAIVHDVVWRKQLDKITTEFPVALPHDVPRPKIK
jgi:hypothetical protein